jgi:cytochrome c oxidase subunit 2
VFVLVEGILLYITFRYRRRDDRVVPPQIHGNTTLEICWTLIPAVILVFIAVPTVQTNFKTQAPAPANALQIEVYGHQWWWEFRYPQYNIVTANEIYVPAGRPVNFSLQTKDVLHSFWVPQLGGKRDLIANHTNHLWFTPDAGLPAAVWNGFCAEYCGTSHGNMHFRVFTVAPQDFESWTKAQQAPAAFNTQPAPAQMAAAAPAGRAVGAVTPVAATALLPAPTQVAGYIFPRDKMPVYAVPHTPTPEGLVYDRRMVGDPARGEKLFTGAGTCLACHTIQGNPMAVGNIGPNLTHVGSRYTIAGGIYPNDTEHLTLWVKNARMMKPGSIMPTLGKGQYDPQLNMKNTAGLDDQQIADIVAYLQALK